MASKEKKLVSCKKCGPPATALTSPWSVGMVSRSWRTEPCSPPVGLFRRMQSNFRFYFLIFLLSSPLLSSVMSRDGFANGAAGQVIFLHESQTEVVFCHERMITRSCLVKPLTRNFLFKRYQQELTRQRFSCQDVNKELPW